MSIQEAQPKKPSISSELVNKILNLPELELPKEWYQVADSERLPQRWDEIAKLINPQQAKALAWDLASQFYNAGHAFRHFRRGPASTCEDCGRPLAIGDVTLVNAKSALFLRLDGKLLHRVLEHKEVLSGEVQHMIKRILQT